MTDKNEMVKDSGLEYPDSTPLEGRPNLRMPMNSILRTRLMIQHEISRQAREQGRETFQEADDFDIDDEEPLSPYEKLFEPPPVDSDDEVVKTAPPSGAAPTNPAAPATNEPPKS